MIVLPNINQLLIDMDGSLLPFNWARLLWWLRKPKSRILRVPLMGVAKKLQNSRMASTLAFMMIEYIRRDAVRDYGRSEEHPSELQSLMRISYAVFCLKQKNNKTN